MLFRSVLASPCPLQSPEGDIELLDTAMAAMNAQPDPGDEERKGCSGHVGKMIFSAGVQQLAIVAYVPDGEHNKSAGNVDVTTWTETVCAAVGGKIVKAATAPRSAVGDFKTGVHGGSVVVAVVAADPDKGKFPLKDKDSAMAAAFNFLREKVPPRYARSSDDHSGHLGRYGTRASSARKRTL